MPKCRCLGAQGQFPIVGGIALIIAIAAFSLALFALPDENVVQLIAGDNITISPDNGYGDVTINSTGGAVAENENNVTRIIAGENIDISPDNGYGDVTISSIGPHWIVVEEIVPIETVDYIEFTGLDGNAAGSYELFISVKNALGAAKDLMIYVNGDYTNANYHCQMFSASHTTVSGYRYNVPYVMGVHANGGATAELSIRRDGDGMFRCNSLSSWNTGADVRIYHRTIIKSSVIGNITSIRIAGSASGVIGENSVFILCSIRP